MTVSLFHQKVVTLLILLLSSFPLVPLKAQVSAEKNPPRLISITTRNAPLERILQEITQETGLYFMGSNNQIDLTEKMSISVKNEPIEKVLDKIFANRGFTWIIKDNTITIIKRGKEETTKGEVKNDSAITIRGTVSSEDGFFLPGATIQIKNTRIGVTTNSNGNFLISNVSDGAILVISYTGYEEQEVTASGADVLIIRLKRASNALDEAVVIGYGRTSRRLNTGNVVRITSDAIEKQPVSNPLQALQGRVSGMVITQMTGIPGGRVDVQIRGQNSLRNLRTGTVDGNLPLYIVDGVPFTSTPMGSLYSNLSIIGGSPLNNINPLDIESIEILKDADATSIYGSRGANGVVLITTKKGKVGKTQLDINAYTGIGKVIRRMDLLNTREYLDMRYEAFKNDGIILRPTTARANDLTKWDTTRSTDWQDIFLGGTANISDATVALSGGNTNTQFLVRGGYHKETTVFPGDFGAKKASVLFNVSHTSSNRKFKVNFSANYISDFNTIKYEDPTIYALTLAPVAPSIYDSLGNLNWQNGTWSNPMAATLKTFKAITDNLIGSSLISYQILPYLQLKTSFGYTKLNLDERTKSPISSFNPTSNPQGSATFGNNTVKTWLIEPQLEFQRAIASGKLNVLVGATFQESVTESEVLRGTGYTNDALLNNLNAASAIQIQSSNYAQYRYNSIFGRISYNYLDRYLLNMTARRDGSSRFGPNKRFANFASVGAGWIFSNEPILHYGNSVLSFGKIRGSFGTTGNDQIGDYGYLDAYLSQPYSYMGRSGLSPDPTRLFNPDYAWEISRKLEFGIELGFFKDRLFLSTSWYKNKSSNQLVGLPVSLITGTSSIQANLPATVKNYGLEFEIRGDIINRKHFEWNSAINFTIPRNKLLNYPDIENSPFNGIYVIGHPLSVWNKFKVTGVDSETGVYTFEDVNRNGYTILDAPGDFLPLENIQQDYYGGISNMLSYKSFSLDFTFQFAKQRGFSYLDGGFLQPGGLSNQPTLVLDRWQSPGDITGIQKFTQQSFSDAWNAYNYNYTQSNAQITNTSFLRLKNVSISYHIPKHLNQKVKLKSSRIYLQGQNLFTITDYKGLDPENQSTRNLPALLVVTGGIQISL